MTLPQRLERALPHVLAVLAVASIALWLYVAWQQIVSPMELFGHEGAVVDHIRRIVQGKAIYVAPSLDFVPFLYTPGYYWLSAAFAWAGDLAFVVPRAVSAFATIGSMFCLGLLVRRGTGSMLWGVVAAGIFALGASRVQAWYALAQVDNVFMFAMALAAVALQAAQTTRQYFVVGVLLAAAFWCKQSGLIAGVAMAVGVAFLHWRYALAVLLGLVAGIGPLLIWMIIATDGWFWFYAFVIPATYGQDLERFAVLRYDLPRLMPGYLIGLAAVTILWRRQQRAAAIKWLTIGAALMFTALAGRTHMGGSANTLIPAVWTTALALGAGAALLQRRLDAAGRRERWLTPAALVMAALEFAGLAYDPRLFLPAPNGSAVVEQMKATIAEASKPILLPGWGFLIGEVGGADPVAMIDVMNVDGELGRKLLEELAQAIREKKFRAIVIEDYGRQRYHVHYQPYYQAVGPLASDIDAQRPRAGLDFGPPWLLLAR